MSVYSDSLIDISGSSDSSVNAIDLLTEISENADIVFGIDDLKSLELFDGITIKIDKNNEMKYQLSIEVINMPHYDKYIREIKPDHSFHFSTSMFELVDLTRESFDKTVSELFVLIPTILGVTFALLSIHISVQQTYTNNKLTITIMLIYSVITCLLVSFYIGYKIVSTRNEIMTTSRVLMNKMNYIFNTYYVRKNIETFYNNNEINIQKDIGEQIDEIVKNNDYTEKINDIKMVIGISFNKDRILTVMYVNITLMLIIFMICVFYDIYN